MQPDQLVHQRQSDAGSLLGAPRLPLDPMKALEQPGQLGRRNADAGVANREFDLADGRSRPQRHRHLALEGIFERVREQVQNDLLPHVAGDKDRVRQGRAINSVAQAGALHRRSEGAGELGRIGGEIDRLVDRLNAPGLDPGEIEQGVDEL